MSIVEKKGALVNLSIHVQPGDRVGAAVRSFGPFQIRIGACPKHFLVLARQAPPRLIFLRFALQPCRVFASAANARKVQQMQKGCVPWTNGFANIDLVLPILI